MVHRKKSGSPTPRRKARAASPRNAKRSAPAIATDQVEGEGSRKAARAYNEHLAAHVRSGRSARAVDEAERALASPEGEELRRAEKTSKARAKEVDVEIRGRKGRG